MTTKYFNGLEHLSISNINSFKRDSLQWYLKYIKGIESKIPSLTMIRGKAIESGVVYQINSKGTPEESTKVALQSFLNELVKVDEELIQVNDEDVSNVSRLVSVIHERSDYSFERNDIEKSVEFVRDCMLWIDFSKYSRNEPAKTQARVLTVLEDTEFPMLGFTDIEFDNVGIELKTTSHLPKRKEDVSLDHLLQIALYSYDKKKDWKIIYLSKPSSETMKAEFILSCKKLKKSDKDIIDRLKAITGTGTTADFIKKVVENPSNYVKESYVEFHYSQQELEKYIPYLKKLINAMTKLIQMDEDEILENCLASYNPTFEAPEDIRDKINQLIYN